MGKKWMTAAAIVGTAFVLFGCGGNSDSVDKETESEVSTWTDGEYEGRAEGMHGDLIVSVSVEGGEIAKVDIVEHAESPGVSDPAIEQIPLSIVEEQSTEVDAVTGVTSSSNTIIHAVNDALSKAE